MPQISMLVYAFLEVTGAKVVKADVACCWSEPPPTVPWQRDEGTFADVISCLDNLAQHLPTRKAWDELVSPPHFAVPKFHARVGTWATYRDGWWSWGECCPTCGSTLASLMGTLCAWPGGCSLRATSWPMTLPAMKWSGFPDGAWLRTSPEQERPLPGS